MGTYTGTSHADTITPLVVSAGVIADPLGSKPSDAADQIYGNGGGDALSGGGGNDDVHASGAGNTLHGDAGDDTISIDMVDTGGANPVTNTAWGDGGNDTIEFIYRTNPELGDGDTWVGQDPSGTITLHGGGGDDTLGNSDSNTNYGDYGIYLDGTTGVFYGEAGNDTMYASSTIRMETGASMRATTRTFFMAVRVTTPTGSSKPRMLPSRRPARVSTRCTPTGPITCSARTSKSW